MHVALAAFAGGKIEFQIRVALRNLIDVLQRSLAEWRAAEIRMQDDSGGVDDRTQGIRQSNLQPLFDS